MTTTNSDAFAMGGNAGDEPVTAEQYAAFEFEPYSPEEVAMMVRDFSMPEWAAEFGRHGQALRLASVVLPLTKQELATKVEAMERDFSGEGPGPTFEFVDFMRHSRKRLRELSDLLLAAELRQLSSASVVELKLIGEHVGRDHATPPL